MVVISIIHSKERKEKPEIFKFPARWHFFLFTLSWILGILMKYLCINCIFWDSLESARPAGPLRHAAGVTAPRQRYALSGASRQLPQRGSHWRAGPLCAGRLRPDRAQKGGPRLRGQRLLDKSTLSSCCESRPQGTTVSGQRKLCSSRVGLTGTPVPLPLGEVSPKVTERACRCERGGIAERD